MLAFLGGTGPEGRGLALRLALAGEQVIIGSRDPSRAKETADQLVPLAPQTHMPGDHERMDQIGRLISNGHQDRIVLAHDVCSKHRLREYGGHGYDHLLSRVAPWMKARGFEDRSIQSMLVDNPARILAFD